MLLANILEQAGEVIFDSTDPVEWEMIGEVATDLENCINDGNYEEAAGHLMELYDRMYHVEGDAPTLGADLEAHKHGIIKGILQYLKTEGMDHAILSVLMLQEYYDINWPELDVIANSAMIDTRNRRGLRDLNEEDATLREIANCLGRLKRRMERRSYMALKDTIHDMEDLGMHDDAIAQALLSAKPELLAWFGRQFASQEAGRSLTNEMIHQVFLLVDIGITWPELAQVLEKNKDSVMRALLQYLQQNVRDNIVLMHIRGYIERFTKLGIRWPELRILWNSIMSELKKQNLDEDSDTDPDWYPAIVDYIGDTDIMSAVNMLKYYGADMHNNQFVAREINASKSYLMRYFQHCLGSSFQGFVEINKEMDALRSIGVDWPELDTFYNDNKDAVMRLLLQQVTSYDEDAGFYTWQELDALKKAGVDWPELAVVERSAMSLMDNKQIDEDDMQESSNLLPRRVYGVLDRMLRMVAQGGSYYLSSMKHDLSAAGASPSMLSDIFNMNKTAILHAIDLDLSSRKVQDGINAIGIVNDTVLGTWPELAESVAKHLDNIKKFISNSLNRGSMSYATHIYEMLLESKLDPAIIKDLKLHTKNTLLAGIKDLIKQRGFTPQVMEGLEALEKMGTRVELGTGKMKQQVLSDFAAALSDNGLDRNSAMFVKLIIKHGDADTNAEMLKVIEEHKTQTVRNMLRLIKVNAAYSVYPIITMLQHLGFKWDELRIIDKTIKSGLLEVDNNGE